MAPVLHNIYNKKELKRKLHQTVEDRITFSFYRYVKIDNPEIYRDQLYKDWSDLKVMGRIYVSNEGINGQVSVPKEKLFDLRNYVDQSSFLKGMRFNYAVEDDGKSFFKLTIKIREKIVADGLNDETFDVTDSGIHLTAEDFNRLADQPETVIVDMRNHYEFEVGHFENAIHPDADTFREALAKSEQLLGAYKDRPVVMYCTGGIRCEKASAWFKHLGFKEVYQLDGGIIQYARDVQAKGLQNKFKGKNFVFDERLGERINNEIISHCHQCGKPCDVHINCVNEACHLLFIQCDECREKFNACCSTECKDFIALPIDEQRIRRKGMKKKANFYRKGRSDLAFAPPIPDADYEVIAGKQYS